MEKLKVGQGLEKFEWTFVLLDNITSLAADRWKKNVLILTFKHENDANLVRQILNVHTEQPDIT